MFDADIDGFDDVQDNISEVDNSAVIATREGGAIFARSLLAEIEATAPRDTGAYAGDWRIEERPNDDRGDIFIVNSTEHGPYLVFPNQKMVGSAKADDPSRGILHNVRGIVHRHRMDYKESVISAIMKRLF